MVQTVTMSVTLLELVARYNIHGFGTIPYHSNRIVVLLLLLYLTNKDKILMLVAS